MDPVVIGLTFLAIFVVELPDKTFLATLVLATKYRPILVWIGVGLAFLVQTLVAVLLGQRSSFCCPTTGRAGRRRLMFLVGAVILFREGRSRRGGRERARRSSPPEPTDARRPAWRAIAAPASWCSSPPSGATCPSC